MRATSESSAQMSMDACTESDNPAAAGDSIHDGILRRRPDGPTIVIAPFRRRDLQTTSSSWP